jgi:hypothetical protein
MNKIFFSIKCFEIGQLKSIYDIVNNNESEETKH